jgi:hypothetical protein
MEGGTLTKEKVSGRTVIDSVESRLTTVLRTGLKKLTSLLVIGNRLNNSLMIERTRRGICAEKT